MCYLMRKSVNSHPSRILATLDIFERHNRVIVFYNFNYELEALSKMCQDSDITYSQWNGHKHEMIPNGFSWIYLIQYAAGAEGWNCVETDTMLFFSQNYSYRAMIQASGRIDRMNTPYEHLYYYHLVSKSKIDQAISKALSHKKNFNEQKYFVF